MKLTFPRMGNYQQLYKIRLLIASMIFCKSQNQGNSIISLNSLKSVEIFRNHDNYPGQANVNKDKSLIFFRIYPRLRDPTPQIPDCTN